MALRWRLAVAFAFATAIVVAVAGLVLVNEVQRSLDESTHARLRTREAVLGRLVVTRAGELRNRPLRPDLLDSAYAPESEQTAQVFSPQDVLVLSYQVDGQKPLLDERQLAAARRAPLEFRSRYGTPGDGDLVRATAVQDPEGRGSWVVAVGANLATADAVVARIRTGLLLGGPMAIGLSAIGAWLLAGASLRPVERLRRQAAALSADDTGARLHVPATGDDIADLARTLNDFLGRLHHALARQRRFVADAGHELRTPLTVLRAELELASRPGRSRGQLQDAVRFASLEADRLIRLAEHLLLLARTDEGRRLLDLSPTSLNELLAAAVRAVARTPSDVQVVIDAPEQTTVLADPERLRQAVDNLLDNALRFAPAGTEVTVRLRSEQGPHGSRAVIEVADRGVGFPPDFLPRAFERFERGDAARTRVAGGSGLGLAIARGLARAHGGDAVAGNRPEGGAVVRLELPLTAVLPPQVPTPDPTPSR